MSRMLKESEKKAEAETIFFPFSKRPSEMERIRDEDEKSKESCAERKSRLQSVFMQLPKLSPSWPMNARP